MMTTRFALAAATGFLLAAPLAAQFTISQPGGNDNFGGRSRGQTFTVSVGLNPSAGTATSLPLTQITLYVGNSGGVATSPTTYLNIYDGDPNNGGSFVGSSTNTIDTTQFAQANSGVFRTPMVWDFPSVQLDLVTEYWGVMSSTNAAGSLDVELSLETFDRNNPNPYAGGSGLIAGIAPHPAMNDCRFEIVFDTGARFSVSGSGCAASAGEAVLSAPGLPGIGQSFDVELSNLTTGSVPALIFGFNDQFWVSFPLPLDLSTLFPFAVSGCNLLVSADSVLPMIPTGATTASLPLTVPANPALVGVPFFVQGLQFEGGSLTVTAKGSAIIGQ